MRYYIDLETLDESPLSANEMSEIIDAIISASNRIDEKRIFIKEPLFDERGRNKKAMNHATNRERIRDY